MVTPIYEEAAKQVGDWVIEECVYDDPQESKNRIMTQTRLKKVHQALWVDAASKQQDIFQKIYRKLQEIGHKEFILECLPDEGGRSHQCPWFVH